MIIYLCACVCACVWFVRVCIGVYTSYTYRHSSVYRVLLQSGDDPRFEHAHEYIEQERSELAALWAARAAEVAKTSFKDDGHLVLPNATNDVPSYTEIYIRLGGVIRLPVDEHTVSIKMASPAQRKTQTASDLRQYQTAVCRMLSLCNVDADFNIDLSQKKTFLQLNYIEIALSKDVPALLKGTQSVEFELRKKLTTGEVIVKHFSLDTAPSRQKRGKEYTSYSSWSYCSIRYETLFPSYWQHRIKKDCPVGCGPVAWAMIFGYYDRRSHEKTSTYGTGSQGLYRCGSDGTKGSKSCKAPETSSSGGSRMKKYIEKFAKTLGTWCIFENGATPPRKMKKIKGFFKVFNMFTLLM